MTGPLPGAVAALLSDWTGAERVGDASRLHSLLTAGFCAVGPLVGFVFPGDAWLARHRAGGLSCQAFDLEGLQIREFGQVAVITARNTMIGAYRGGPIPEAMRATLVAVRAKTGWRLAHAHTSFLAGTRGAPPIPGSSR